MADVPEKHQTAEGTAGDKITLVTLLEELSKTTTTSSTQHSAMDPTSTTPPNTPHAAPQVMGLPIVPALDISAIETCDSPASHVIGQLPVCITIICVT